MVSAIVGHKHMTQEVGVVPIAALDDAFEFRSGSPQPVPEPPTAPDDPLAPLVGTWSGTGFNAIWRPGEEEGSDRFLMLSLTREHLTVSRIAGVIPNRGLLQGDIGMTGVTYMDQISDSFGNGLHIEPGIWAVVPATTNPAVPESVVRMASIPHGTTILAQGVASSETGPPTIPSVSLAPMSPTGGPEGAFIELQLSQPSNLRTTPLPGEITQALLDDPNSLLREKLTGLTVAETTTLTVSTGDQPVPGGGTANTAFLAGPANPTGGQNEQGNASANLVNAIFWIESVAAAGDTPAFMQLQYSQTVMLDFNGIRWPHVTVSTLRQQSTGPEPVIPRPPAVGS